MCILETDKNITMRKENESYLIVVKIIYRQIVSKYLYNLEFIIKNCSTHKNNYLYNSKFLHKIIIKCKICLY